MNELAQKYCSYFPLKAPSCDRELMPRNVITGFIERDNLEDMY